MVHDNVMIYIDIIAYGKGLYKSKDNDEYLNFSGKIKITVSHSLYERVLVKPTSLPLTYIILLQRKCYFIHYEQILKRTIL